MSKVSAVSSTAKQGTETRVRDWSWVEASIWTERMLAALENGVKGGKWFILINAGRTPTSLGVGFSP